jgi:hypothetical protein
VRTVLEGIAAGSNKEASYEPSETVESISSARTIEDFERFSMPVTFEVTDTGSEILTFLQRLPYMHVPSFNYQFHPNWIPQTEINKLLMTKLLVKPDIHEQFKVFTVAHLSRLFTLTEAKRILSSQALEQDYDSAEFKQALKQNKDRFWKLVKEKRAAAAREDAIVNEPVSNTLAIAESMGKLKARYKAFLSQDPA